MAKDIKVTPEMATTIILKAALEYNANVVAQAAISCGNIYTKEGAKQFIDWLKKQGEYYAKKIDEATKLLEDTVK